MARSEVPAVRLVGEVVLREGRTDLLEGEGLLRLLPRPRRRPGRHGRGIRRDGPDGESRGGRYGVLAASTVDVKVLLRVEEDVRVGRISPLPGLSPVLAPIFRKDFGSEVLVTVGIIHPPAAAAAQHRAYLPLRTPESLPGRRSVFPFPLADPWPWPWSARLQD